jgi:hypothetical protein
LRTVGSSFTLFDRVVETAAFRKPLFPVCVGGHFCPFQSHQKVNRYFFVEMENDNDDFLKKKVSQCTTGG